MSLGGAVQPQVKVGQANDPHEREAEQVADRVVRRQPAPDITPVPPGGTEQRISAEMIEGTRPSKTTEEKQDEKAPALPLRPGPVQRQAAEQRQENMTEAPRAGPVQRQVADEKKKEEAATAGPQPLPIQRRTGEDTAEEPQRVQPRLVQRLVLPAEKRGGETSTDHGAVSRALQRGGTGGEPLEPGMRAAMESSTGRDFGGVRVHHDDSARSAAGALGARAFAHGNGIWLGRGESPGDERLMAHEAAHVAQQGGAPAWNAPAAAAAPVTQGLDAEEAPVRRQPTPGTPAAAATPPAAPPGAPPGPPAVPPADVAPGEIDLKGLPELLPEKVPQSIASYLEERQGKGRVMLRFGAIAAGPAEMRRRDDRFLVDREALPLSHPLFARIGEVAPGLQPSLIVSIGRDRKVRGQIGIKAGKRLGDLASMLQQGPALLGLKGFAIPEVRGLTNKLEDGRLVVGAADIPIRLGKVLSGTFSFELSDGDITTLGGTVNVAARGVVNGSISLLRAVKGGAVVVSGKASLALNLPAHFSGSIEASWDGEAFSGVGEVGYQGEKLSGKVTLRLMQKSLADQLEAEKKAPPPEAGAAPAAAPAAGGTPKDEPYVVFGEGDLAFAFNDWLNGSAHVIVDPKGFVTVIGKITPQKEFPLFEPKSYNKELFKLEARAAYGIPVVGNVFLFANIGLSAFAGIQGKLYKITAEGTYSTDPEKAKSFTIQGSLNISAKAGLTLRAEGGVGLEILGHDIKAGAGINASAGVRGYAEATPIIGYREKGKPGEDKKGEFFIRGDVEVAAQAFLELSGDLFVQLDSPWWSPAPDKTWTWPLFDKSWPIGGTLGAGLMVDYVFGSGQAPALEFKKVDFSADKFMDDMINDKAEKKAAEAPEQKSAWKERNEKAAEPPAGPSKPGNAQPGQAPAPAAAKPKAERGGPKKPKKGADTGGRTADGKSVKQHQEEALRQGKRPDDKSAAKGKDDHDRLLAEGLAALEAVTTRYAQTGATREELQAALKSVRRKFKIFKSIELVEAGTLWKYKYAASDGELKGPPTKVSAANDKPLTGTAVLGKEGVTREKALAQLAQITKAEDVGPALVELQKREPKIVERYKGDVPNRSGKLEGYKQYLNAKKNGQQIEWPLTYMKNRASRSRGKKTEVRWKDLVFPGAGPKEFRVYEEDGWQVRIPDIVTDAAVGDVKNVKEQDFSLQLRSFYVVAKLRDPITKRKKKVIDAGGNEVTAVRSFELIVRSPTHSEAYSPKEGTRLSGPLRSALDKTHPIITDQEEES
jgi:hypothetical protein